MAQSKNGITEQHRSFVISYILLRRSIGVLGIALPMVLLIGFSIAHPDCILPPSISHYYYTMMGTYFTGTLCAVGLFLSNRLAICPQLVRLNRRRRDVADADQCTRPSGLELSL